MAIRNYRAGGFITDTPSDIIALYGQVSANGNGSHLRRVGSTSGYQITAAKTFYICRVSLTADGAASTYAIALGYADNDIGFDTTTARTNPVTLIGNSEGTGYLSIGGWNGQGNVDGSREPGQLHNGIIPLPLAAATKYLYFRSANNTGANPHGLLILGFEV